MHKILETDRLLLRELEPADAAEFFNLNQNPDVIRYTGDEPFGDIAAARAFLENYKDYQQHGYGRWAVIEKTTDTFTGWCGLKYDPTRDETDIGFRFFEHFWNRGFATESALACLNYGFRTLRLENIVGRVMQENTASIRVLEKIGLAFEREQDFGPHKGLLFRIENPGIS